MMRSLEFTVEDRSRDGKFRLIALILCWVFCGACMTGGGTSEGDDDLVESCVESVANYSLIQQLETPTRESFYELIDHVERIGTIDDTVERYILERLEDWPDSARDAPPHWTQKLLDAQQPKYLHFARSINLVLTAGSTWVVPARTGR